MKKIFAVLACAFATTSAWAYDTPTMGWSSWNAYGFQISESIIKSQADALVTTGLKDAGYIYVNIDDGFFGGRDSEGHLLIHPTRFPNGMRTVVDYIHDKGLKAGIYSDAGKNTCASYWGGDKIGEGVGLYGHDQEDIDLYFKELNFDFIKVDFCGGSPGHNSEQLSLSERERYTAISEAIKNTGRTDVRLNVCRWAFPGTWVHDVATSWRISEDIYLGWNSIKSIVGQNLYLSAYATEGKYNDMDMLEVGRGLTTEEDKTHFGMWCIMSSPLLIGCDMTTITPEALELMTNPELIALNQDELGLQAYVVDKVGGAYLLVKDVETLYGTTRAIAVYNPTDNEVVRQVDFLSLNLGGKVAVRDLFERRDMGTFAAAMNVTVPAHGTRIYLLTAEKRYERSTYEGETAWLSAYQELTNNQSSETGIYEEASYCSGGAMASWLGRRGENDLQWRHVYSQEGGEYTLTLSYISGEARNVYLQVNGGEAQVLSVNSGGWNTVARVETTVTLQPGENIIRLYNPSAWMPNIDCMVLERKNSLDLYEQQLESARGKVGLLLEGDLPEGIKQALQQALTDAQPLEETAAAYQSAIKILQQAHDDALEAIAIYPSIESLAEVCRSNIANSEDSDIGITLMATIDEVTSAVSKAQTASRMSALLTQLQEKAIEYHTSIEANPLEGRSWDVTFMITNPTFDADGNGWNTSPTVRSGVGEFWNTDFSMFQTVKPLKNGQYEVSVQALYRTGENDGGSAYNSGKETIPAKLRAGTKSQVLKSLYCYPLSSDAASFGTLDLKNGYANSMYAASVCFEDDAYWNTLKVDITNKSLRIGLITSTSKYDSWCCFDNFRLEYLGGDPATATSVLEATEPSVDIYSIDGVLLKSNVLQDATEGLSRGIYILRNGDNVSKVIVR